MLNTNNTPFFIINPLTLHHCILDMMALKVAIFRFISTNKIFAPIPNFTNNLYRAFCKDSIVTSYLYIIKE